mgnify:CR=1 FL=1
MIDEESDRLNRFIEGLSTPRYGAGAADSSARDRRRRVHQVGPAPRRDRHARSPHGRLGGGGDPVGHGGRGVHHGSDLHPARQRQQIRAGGHDDCGERGARGRAQRSESRCRTKGRGSRSTCVSACSRSSSAYRPASRTIRVAAASASACPSRAGSVETQGGRIWIDTPASGRGTTVVMTIPPAGETDIRNQNGDARPGTLEAQQRTA